MCRLTNSFICAQQQVPMRASRAAEEKEMVRVWAELGKQKLKVKLPIDTKILHFEEFLRRDLNVTPTQTLFLFESHHRKLMVLSKTLADYARQETFQEYGKEEERGKVLNVIVRKTDSF